MAYGNEYTLEEEFERDGALRRRLAAAPALLRSGERDMRVHYSLSTSYPATHPLFITAGQPITMHPPSKFTKYRILVRDPASDAFIGVGREPGQTPGTYDDLCPGGNALEDRCELADFFVVVFDVAPATPVEVILSAGRLALPV